MAPRTVMPGYVAPVNMTRESFNNGGGGGSSTIPSPGVPPKQPLRGKGLYDPLYGR